MRLLFIAVVSAASSVAAQGLTASGDVTFTLTTPLPIADLSTSIDGMGTVTLGCTPCSNPSNTQHYAYSGVHFVYEQAPGDPSVATGNGNQTDSTQTSIDYTVTLLPAGVRVYPRLVDVVCTCGNMAQVSPKIQVDKTSLAVTINPVLIKPLFVYEGATSLVTHDPDKVPVGVAVRLPATCFGTPKGAETLQLKLSGAGVDVTQNFPSSDALMSPGVMFTATTPGDITVTCSLEPYGAASAPQTLTAIDASSGTGGGSGGTGGGSDATGGGSAPHGGCAQTPGLAALLAALTLGRRRYERA